MRRQKKASADSLSPPLLEDLVSELNEMQLPRFYTANFLTRTVLTDVIVCANGAFSVSKAAAGVKPRPITIIFGDEQAQMKMVRLRKNVTYSGQHENVFNNDFSKLQIG
ncbi:hypothetical protein WA026_002938 [Henosepilachna vigintioctopunctata]|uniref:Uncharacterized protein n=1 Tax=Henosepilachna vigintioctopunctata TaxID=420089 RepID=A0AAW1TL21_9CUCU